ncbi:LLM class flavin-dependent oxidoreductase [Rhodococcus sp. KBS0724]|uniref:LLM class flavin-dependent oxidoreductase n=1 Tax=Rhodococcus sp. KBS0724 TaxID=1179674 RepID=UPI00110F5946|nr:LLM class flavin-dependent oxidoreductase [Rhodococcus sp. KBS0724]TSD40316.1 LLM class flavin-dependent oxidoreductase [Rhodococcus sp. KBS0724]
MKFGIQFTQQLPRPWTEKSERDLFASSLDQVALADTLGYDYAWAVEQHFLEEYSHSSAPEIFLAAASQRTNRIRLGHGIVLMPPGYNEPVRVAERIATLDLLSGGRLDFGVGDSKSRMELEGFGIEPSERRDMTTEALEQVSNMLALEPFPGFTGKHFAMPARNVVPKPTQKPHPPLWMAASDEATIQRAARIGVGVLAHGFADASEAKRIVDEYYEIFKTECIPIGHNVNPNIAMLNPFYCNADEDDALRIGMSAHGFGTYAVRHYYTFGRHRPGHTDIAAHWAAVREELGGDPPIMGSHAIGTPRQLAQRMRDFSDAGIDQVVLLHQAGTMTHDQISASLSLFASEVMPEFAETATERARRKYAELAPYIQDALERRRQKYDAVDLCEIPSVEAYGLTREAPNTSGLPPGAQAQMATLNRMRILALRLNE